MRFQNWLPTEALQTADAEYSFEELRNMISALGFTVTYYSSLGDGLFDDPIELKGAVASQLPVEQAENKVVIPDGMEIIFSAKELIEKEITLTSADKFIISDNSYYIKDNIRYVGKDSKEVSELWACFLVYVSIVNKTNVTFELS